MTSPAVSQAAAEAARTELALLVESTKGINLAVLASADGFKVAAAGSQGALVADKLSAIASSIHALGTAIAKETGVEPCQIVAIEGLLGSILVVELPRMRNGMLLAVSASDDAVMAALRLATKTCAGRIARAFGGN